MTKTMTRPHSATIRRAVVAGLLGLLTMTATVGTATAADPTTIGGAATTAEGAAIEPQALSSGQLTVQKVVSGFSSPIGVTNAGDDSGRLFVVQRNGLVRIVQGKSITGTFIDARTLVSQGGGEQGLLGLAFHPDFATNRLVYIYYTRQSDGDIVVSRLTANSGGTNAPISSAQKLLEIEHSQYANHNGGAMAFGPDGYLYIGTGDGGGGGDPLDNGQDITNELLGKILRIDVDGTGDGPFGRYANPGSNPFEGATAGDDEIWAYGLRNPWRMSFDRVTGSLWIGDVGQNRWEEVNREPAGDAGGNNYGWNVMEGKACYPSGNPCSFGDLPEAVYATSLGCAITGGFVYRGPSQRDMQGLYVLGDYCSGVISTMTTTGTTITQRRDTSLLISSFGESESGELYLTHLGGTLYRVIAPEFSDIATSTFVDDIHWLLYEGITGGCGGTKFCPTTAVSRVQMAQFLDRAIGLPDTGTDFFTDDDGITGEASINRLAASGITGGCEPGKYCPTAKVTREQMAIFLDRALDLPSTGTDYFTDDTGRTGEAAINRLAAAGLTGGCGGGKYCPTASVTREQMAAFLRRAFDTD